MNTLHPDLLGTPSPETRKHRCLHKLGEAAARIIELIDLLKVRAPLLREPEHWSDGVLREHFARDDALRAIEDGDYKKAHHLIQLYGAPAEKPR